MATKPRSSGPDLERLFNPRSVTIIGASQNIKTISGQPVWSLAKHGYKGRLFPVNPKYDTVEGHRCYPSVESLPEVPDLALILVAAARVPQMLREVGKKGIPFCIIFSSGFAETGAEGLALQKEIAAIAREHSIRVVGPNCQGMIGVTDDVYAGFGSAFSGDNFRQGSLSMTTQSGGFGYGVIILAEESGLGFRSIVSTGNESGLTTTDFIEWFTQDPQTKVIGAYMEGVKDAHRLLGVGDKALDADKPVLIWKVGNTDVGQRAAASHTANLGGALALYEAAFRQRGMIRVRDANELINYTQVFECNKRPAGNRVAIVTISGGGGILMADQCVESGLSVGPLTRESELALKDIIPAFGSWQNPIDITAGIFNNPEMLAQAMQIIVDDPSIDSVVVIFASLQGEIATQRAKELVELSARTTKPILAAWSAREKFAADAYRILAQGRVPRFSTPVSCGKALAALTTFAEAQRRRAKEKSEPVLTLDRPEAKAMLAGRSTDLAEYQAKALISAYGIPVTREVLAKDRAAAVVAAKEIGFPVVMKVQSTGIAHKTEAGGVRIGVPDVAAVEAAFDAIVASAKAYAPDAVIDGVSVQEMVSGGTELIVGVQNDPLFGPAVMVGLGGIYAEVFKDVSFRLAPLTRSVAESMLHDLKCFPLLDGARGRPKADVDAVVDVLMKLSALSMDLKHELAELDINPLLVLEQGRGVRTLDALAKPHTSQTLHTQA